MGQENLGTAVTESQNARFPPRFKTHLKGVHDHHWALCRSTRLALC